MTGKRALAALAVMGGLAAPHLAMATADGPDVLKVVAAKGGGVALRTGPSAQSATISILPPGTDGLANLGCIGGMDFAAWSAATAAERTKAELSRWCRVGFGREIGWMAGMTLGEGGAPVQFAGGKPLAALDGTRWRLTALGAAPVTIEAWIAFDGAGRAAGHAGCNRFNAGYTHAGSRLSFGPAATTRMACPEPLEAIERGLLDAIGRARTATATEGLLALFDEGQVLLATFARQEGR